MSAIEEMKMNELLTKFRIIKDNPEARRTRAEDIEDTIKLEKSKLQELQTQIGNECLIKIKSIQKHIDRLEIEKEVDAFWGI